MSNPSPAPPTYLICWPQPEELRLLPSLVLSVWKCLLLADCRALLSADEGAGIYRHVYLIGTGATHIEQDGVFAPATVTSEIVRAQDEAAVEDNSGGLSADATVHASATVVGPDSVTVKFTLYDGDEAVAHGSSAAAGAGAHNASLSVSGAKVC